MSCGCQEQRAKVIGSLREGDVRGAAGHAATGVKMMAEGTLRMLSAAMKIDPQKSRFVNPKLLTQIHENSP